ncbi:MAG: hypothetical protein E7553_05135 [Ruminococcaceae bacterium]|nr:hypothetical protein [Oscillospiraceae bacterium]
MRHIFIINPAAGKHENALNVVPEIEEFFTSHKEFGTPTIEYTNGRGHATELARAYAHSGEPVRLYACGGDGTLAEVLQGMHDAPTAELACIPCGSGNDYLRMFEGRDFRNIAALVSGHAQKMDLISCDDGVSLNIACLGMDADVAYKMVKYKHLPLVSGSMAYNLAIADVFFHPLGKELTITMETTHGKVERKGRYLFALAASGQYYGGGYKGAPMARPDDGILDFVLIKKMSRLSILKFLPKYKSGDILDCPYFEHFRGTSMTVHCDEDVVVALDGECYTGTDKHFSLCDHTINFVMPANGAIKQAVFSAPTASGGQKKALSGAFENKS